VLWHCWLGGRKGIRPVKNWVVGCWHGYLSGARSDIWPSCHSLSLASVKSRLVLPFLYRLTRVVLDKGPLNGCVCVCVCDEVLMWFCLEQGADRLQMVQLMPLPSPSSLASFKSRLVIPFWYRLSQVVLEKRPLNGCSSSSSSLASDRDHQAVIVGGPNTRPTSPRCGRPPFWKQFNRHISTTVRLILMKFGTVTHIGS